MAIVRIASVPLWTRSKPCARRFYLYIFICDAFVGGDHDLACIKQWCEMLVLKLLCFRYYYFIWNLGCNNFNRTLKYGNVFVNSM